MALRFHRPGPRHGRCRPALRDRRLVHRPLARRSRHRRPGDRSDILGLYRNLPPRATTRAAEDYRRAREAADRQRVLDYAALDAAAALAGTIESAQGSFADLTSNGNLSNTALQQAGVAAALSQGRINAALGQVLAHQTAMQVSRARQAELARLEWLARWSEGRARANALAETMRDAASLNRTALRGGLLFQIPSFYR